MFSDGCAPTIHELPDTFATLFVDGTEDVVTALVPFPSNNVFAVGDARPVPPLATLSEPELTFVIDLTTGLRTEPDKSPYNVPDGIDCHAVPVDLIISPVTDVDPMLDKTPLLADKMPLILEIVVEVTVFKSVIVDLPVASSTKIAEDSLALPFSSDNKIFLFAMFHQFTK